MPVQDDIYHIIRQVKPISLSIHETTNLYKDIGFDSLSFIKLLIDIEEVFAIQFDIMEMEECIIVGNLITKVLEKQKGK